jgi:hypothetical protein
LVFKNFKDRKCGAHAIVITSARDEGITDSCDVRARKVRYVDVKGLIIDHNGTHHLSPPLASTPQITTAMVAQKPMAAQFQQEWSVAFVAQQTGGPLRI